MSDFTVWENEVVSLADGTPVEVDIDCDGLWIMVADDSWYRFTFENGLKLMAAIASMYNPEAVAVALAKQGGVSNG